MEENGIDSSNSDTVEREMGKLCDKATNKEERFVSWYNCASEVLSFINKPYQTYVATYD